MLPHHWKILLTSKSPIPCQQHIWRVSSLESIFRFGMVSWRNLNGNVACWLSPKTKKGHTVRLWHWKFASQSKSLEHAKNLQFPPHWPRSDFGSNMSLSKNKKKKKWPAVKLIPNVLKMRHNVLEPANYSNLKVISCAKGSPSWKGHIIINQPPFVPIPFIVLHVRNFSVDTCADRVVVLRNKESVQSERQSYSTWCLWEG